MMGHWVVGASLYTLSNFCDVMDVRVRVLLHDSQYRVKFKEILITFTRKYLKNMFVLEFVFSRSMRISKNKYRLIAKKKK